MMLLNLPKFTRRRLVNALLLAITITSFVALLTIIATSGYGHGSCVVIVQPTPGALNLQQGGQAGGIKDQCFHSLAEAVSYATGGAVSLPRDASAAEISAALRNQE